MPDPRSHTRQSIKYLISAETKKSHGPFKNKQKGKKYRNCVERINSTYGRLELEDYKEIIRLADYHGLEKSVYQKKACLAYGRSGKVIPKNIQKSMSRLLIESHRANALVSEWTQQAGFFQKTSAKQLEEAVLMYRKLTKELEDLLWQLSKKP